MNRYELGIVDTRNIIQTLSNDFGYDFKNYALTFFKRRVEILIQKHSLKDADGFIHKLETEKEFIEVFLSEVCVETTEIFRDPSMWRLLKEKFLVQMVKNNPSFKIWFPEISSGEELFSIAILLKKLNLLDNVKFIASSISEHKINKIQEGRFGSKKYEVNEANYNRVFSDETLKEYYEINDDVGFWDTSLIKNTKFIKQNSIFDDYPKGIKLIICRNQMIYYNQILQERFLKNFYFSLVPGGHMIIGNNEKVDYWNSDKDYILVNESESIYKKKLS